jgi:hypothetical protein
MNGRPDMMMSSARVGIICLLVLTLLPPQPASAQAKWKGTVVKEGDVTIVKNPRDPIYTTALLELEEELSIGGPEASGEAVFARMGEFVVDDSGNFYISARRGDDHVRVFDKSGRYLRTIGRHGQGPGEFDGIGPLSFVRATGELAVANIRLGCLTYFNGKGTYLRDLRLEVHNYVVARLDSKGMIYGFGGGFEIGKPYFETRWAAIDPEGRPASILIRIPGQVKGKISMFGPGIHWLIDDSDDLVVGLSEFYELQIFDAHSQRLTMRIHKDFDPVPVSQEELTRYKKPEMAEMGFEFAKQHAAFWNIFASDTGYLFVETFEKGKAGGFIHDVFDKEGRLVARMPFKSHGVKISAGKYYALEEDEDGYQYVKRYAVTWKVN